MIEVNGQKIALVSDTACDLSDEQLRQYDVRLISLRLLCSKGEFRDRTEISNDELFELLKTELPKSSLPMPGDTTDLYNQLIEEGCTHIFHVCMSSGLSGTYNMVRLVAQDFEDRIPITVFDTKTLASGSGLLVLEAGKKLLETGSISETLAHLERVRESQLGCFVIRTLEFLRKGGRIGLVEGVVGTILQLKPVIFVNDDGIYQTLAKARGYTSAVETMIREVTSRYKNKKVRLAIVHAQAREEAEKVLAKLKLVLDIHDVYIAPISPILAIHTGPGLVGVIAQHA